MTNAPGDGQPPQDPDQQPSGQPPGYGQVRSRASRPARYGRAAVRPAATASSPTASSRTASALRPAAVRPAAPYGQGYPQRLRARPPEGDPSLVTRHRARLAGLRHVRRPAASPVAGYRQAHGRRDRRLAAASSAAAGRRRPGYILGIIGTVLLVLGDRRGRGRPHRAAGRPLQLAPTPARTRQRAGAGSAQPTSTGSLTSRMPKPLVHAVADLAGQRQQVRGAWRRPGW